MRDAQALPYEHSLSALPRARRTEEDQRPRMMAVRCRHTEPDNIIPRDTIRRRNNQPGHSLMKMPGVREYDQPAE